MQHASAFREIVDAGRVVPDELEPPELLPGLMSYYDDFLELSTDRQIGMAVGRIPAASIARHTAGWPEEDADAFRIVIRAMDEVYLDLSRKGDADEPDPLVAQSDNPARDAFRSAFRGR